MSEKITYYKFLEVIEKEYVNNHEFISSFGEKERDTFIRTMKQSCWKLNINVLTYMRLLERDKNSCAICGKLRKDVKGKLCLDHNHFLEDSEGYVEEDEPIESYGGEFIRGFLCSSCNLLLGYAGDNFKILKKVIYYLKNFVPYDNILYFPNKKHKLLESDRQKMYQEQNGKCKICGIKESELRRELCTDHDHNTGYVRGLLCGGCNSLLGLCHDDIYILKQAILYLKRRSDNGIYYNMDITFMKGKLPPEFLKYAVLLFGKDWKKMFPKYYERGQNVKPMKNDIKKENSNHL